MIKLISSRILMFVLLLAYAVAMGVATFVESAQGTDIARRLFYYSWWFIGIEFLLAVNLLAIIFTTQMFALKRWGDLLFHVAFLVILAGAGITHFFSFEGIMHIREGEQVNYMRVGKSMLRQDVPFEVYLKDFRLERYPGSHSPSSYESDLVVTVDGKRQESTVYMNNVLDVKGYRLFQSSFDKDEQGTVLSVNYDKPGMLVSYTGYLLLVAGMIVTLFDKNSRFRKLNKQLKGMVKKGGVALALAGGLCLLQVPAKAQGTSDFLKYTVSKEHAGKFGQLLVQNPKGRIEPVNTWTSKILRKLYQADRFEGLTSDQFFLNLSVYPYEWAGVPFIKMKNAEILSKLQKKGPYLAYHDLFDAQGRYIFADEVEQAYAKSPSQRNRYDSDLLKLDEMVNIVYQVQAGRMLALFPDVNDKNSKWYSAGDDLSVFRAQDSMFVSKIMRWYAAEIDKGVRSGDWKSADEVLEMIGTYQTAQNKTIPIDQKRIDRELQYNKANIFSDCFKLYLALGIALLAFAFVSLFKNNRMIRMVSLALSLLVGAAFAYHSYGLGLRWYIAGHAPWTNSYESMVYVGWAIVLAGLIFVRRSYVLLALASILAGMVLFVSSLNWMSPEITPLVPVLQSYWLMLHVAVIMAGYGFFFISALIGLFNLILMIATKGQRKERIDHHIDEMTVLNEMSMILALLLMTIGTFLGAVWANESWGRYWGWDPKETWALITVIAYAIVLHLRFIPKMGGRYLFNLLSVAAISTVLMTYFGVNYYLSGLHSYGKSDAQLLPAPFIIGIVVVVVLAIGAKWRERKNRKIDITH